MMWTELLKKELRLQKDFMLGALIVLILLGGIAVGLGLAGHGNLATLFVIVPLIWHFLFLPIYMSNSLNYEWKHASSTWLQMPLPGWKLLLAKAASGLIYFFGTFTLAFLVMILCVRIGLDGTEGLLNWFQPLFQNQGDAFGAYVTRIGGTIVRSYLLLLAFVLYTNLFLAPFFILFSVFRQWLRGALSKGAGIITLAVWATGIWLCISVSETDAYRALTDWGEIGLQWERLQIGPFYTGDVLVDVILSVLLVALAGWLIDRKVQV